MTKKDINPQNPLQKIARYIETLLPRNRYGFAVFVFKTNLQPGEESRCDYVSNCNRSDIVSAMQEFTVNQALSSDTDPHEPPTKDFQ